jgi:hypothetical protein
METAEELKPGVEPMPSRVDLMIPIIKKIMSGEMRLSYTALSNFMDSPKDFADYKLQKKEPTPAMIYGGMLHCLILEPGKFDERYFAFDDSDKVEELRQGGSKNPRATKAYKEWRFIACGQAGDRTIVSPKEHAHAKIVALNVIHNRASARIMRACPKRETPIDWEWFNFFFHGVIDLLGDEDMADVKSMPDAQQDKVQREIWYRKLYLQAVIYLTGLKIIEELAGLPWKQRKYHIIAVDKLGGISVHTLNERLLKHGIQEMEYYMKRFNYAILTEAWDQSYDFWSDQWTGLFMCDKAGWMYDKD